MSQLWAAPRSAMALLVIGLAIAAAPLAWPQPARAYDGIHWLSAPSGCEAWWQWVWNYGGWEVNGYEWGARCTSRPERQWKVNLTLQCNGSSFINYYYPWTDIPGARTGFSETCQPVNFWGWEFRY